MNIASQVDRLPSMEAELQAPRSVGNWWKAVLIRSGSVFQWIKLRAQAQHARKNLRVCENISLGEKRFVAVVQVDGERFLIGGSSSSVSLLTRLQEANTFSAHLEREAGKIS
jgi:flagellar biogenesis protein FliO